jgi:hypothetical protein
MFLAETTARSWFAARAEMMVKHQCEPFELCVVNAAVGVPA